MYTGSTRFRPNVTPKGERDKGYVYTYSTGNKKFTSGKKVTIDDFEVDYDTNSFDLYGQFQKAIYTIEFNANGGTWVDGTKGVKTETISNGEKIKCPSPSGPRKFNG